MTLNVYPNPSEGHFTVESGNYTGAVLFNCYDLSGRLVYSQQTNVNRGEMTEVILGDDLAGGSYFFQIATDQGMVTKQIVIQK